MTNRIDETFAKLRAAGRKAFMPFVTAGDPSLEATEALIRDLAKRGATHVELGLPYSDPVADGPTIQASYNRALAAGTTLDSIFAMVKHLRRDCQIPISAMGSFTLVARRGVQRFLDEAKAAGVDGLIIPDLPLEEVEAMAPEAAARGLDQIMLIAPTTPPERAAKIAARATGFIYYISVSGITGERAALPTDVGERVAALRQAARVPVCVGFGISKPEHVRAVAAAADGVIVGSAIVRRIEEMAGRTTAELVEHVGRYVEELVAALPR
jgi:tryptophan synthase alpha chain